MKTLATAAVLMMLAVPAWAEEVENEQANAPGNSDKPIVLSEAEMDGVTAGRVFFNYHHFHNAVIDINGTEDPLVGFNYSLDIGGVSQ